MLEKKIVNAISAFNMRYAYDSIIIGFSGGADSSALLHFFKDKAKKLVAVHINHMIRGEEADRDEAFCVSVCKKYGIDCITHARKPFSKGIRQCIKKYAADPLECALVGDQIYTDTLGANCVGVRSVLVTAINNHNFWLKLRHCLEKPFIFAARKRRIQL